MRVQTVVQHHPSRAHLLPSLLRALPEGAQVVADPEPDGPRSPWRAYLACLRALEPDASHLLIVQDDAEPCRNVGETLARALRSVPADPLVLFVPGVGLHRRRVLAACASGQRYAQLPAQTSFVPCVAVCWPRAAVESILAWEERRPAAKPADDGNLGAWAERAGFRIMATVPSLFEHPDRELSLVGRAAKAGANPARVAACWAGDMDPLELDW